MACWTEAISNANLKSHQSGKSSPPDDDKMKNKILILCVVVVIGCWSIWRSDYFAANFRTGTFYQPIFVSDFDVLQKGATISGYLKKRFDVPYAFFLVLPCSSPAIEPFVNLDGKIQYSLEVDGKSVQHETISPQNSRPIVVYTQDGCKVLLFSLEIPNSLSGNTVTLKVTILSPITKLRQFSGSIRGVVAPAIWPK